MTVDWVLTFARDLALAVWLGGLIVIDLVETPARFRVKAINRNQVVAVGREVFAALNRMEVDTFGLDEMDRKLLLMIIQQHQGGPVGLNHMSAALQEEKDSIEEIIEPYLIQIGFLNRTPRGRTATRLAYEHFQIEPPRAAQAARPGLFDAD